MAIGLIDVLAQRRQTFSGDECLAYLAMPRPYESRYYGRHADDWKKCAIDIE